MAFTYNIMGSTPLRDLGFVGTGKCADLLETAGFYAVADVRACSLLEASRKIQNAIDSVASSNKTRLAFKAFRCVFALIKATCVADDIPECFQCPISRDWMHDPVVTPSGITYDRPNIIAWIESFENGISRDPMSGTPLTVAQLVPNRALRDAIARYRPLEERFLVNYEEAMSVAPI